MVPAFTAIPFDGLGTRLYPCDIAMVTPQTFTMASRHKLLRPCREFPEPRNFEVRVRAADQPESVGLELADAQEA